MTYRPKASCSWACKQLRVKEKLPCSVCYHTDAKQFSKASRYGTAQFILLMCPPWWSLSFRAVGRWEEPGDALQGLQSAALPPGEGTSAVSSRPGHTGSEGLSHTNDPGDSAGRDGWGEHNPSSSSGCISSAELTGANSTLSPQKERASRAQLEKGICGIRGRCARLNVWQQTGCAEGRWKARFNINRWKGHLGTKVLGLNTLWPHHCPPRASITLSFPRLCSSSLFRSFEMKWIPIKNNIRMAKSQLKTPIFPTPFTCLLLIQYACSNKAKLDSL